MKYWGFIPEPIGPLTGEEQILIGGHRWVCAATWPAYDANASYQWRRPVKEVRS